ncbi:MAG: hypothetical protein HY828_14045 [Actinobacteria bacterium]|nr:hypothetical protein [Actinomycetota bacterium]
MILVPLLVVVVAVGIVYTVRRRHAHVTTSGDGLGAHHAVEISAAGRWSLVVLAAGLLLWSFTRTTLPIYFAASLGWAAFVVAVVAMVQFHDRSPLLMVPLVFVPLATAAGAAFVLLQ